MNTKTKAGTKEWAGLAVLTLGSLLIMLDIGVLNFAVPAMSADLRPSAPELLWIMDIYPFALAGLLIPMGWVGDRIGRRKLLITGALLFGAASACAAMATTPEALIASRALLGVAAAPVTPTVLGMIRVMFDDADQRRTAIAAWTGVLTSSTAFGPVIGGLLLNHFWWGSVFLINIPVMVLLVALAPFLLPEHRDPSRGKLDAIGAVLSFAAILTVVYGVKESAVNGYSPSAVLSIAAGLALGFAFVQRQRTVAGPLLDLELFRYRAFSGSVAITLIVHGTLIGINLLVNQYLMSVLGMRPFTAALWSLAAFPVVAMAAPITATYSRRVRPGNFLACGMVVMAVGCGLLFFVRADSPVLFVMAGVALIAAGLLMVKARVADIVLTAAPPERAGSSAAVSETANELGNALGFAAFGTIGLAVFHHRMADVHPRGLSSSDLDAARGSIGGTTSAAGRLTGGTADSLLHAGREAFTHGLDLAALTAAGVLGVTAVLSAILLRKEPIAAPAPAGAAGAAGSVPPRVADAAR
ncbi:MFS transporter [Streptomyces sp. NBC_01023]|uniref:MFS transporter n=1 Tax=Streptomyces sp. NBC_01023 TaxID=2903724 RepID=UPI0038644B5D|nr:MFS transporter [Streptomyces sp. NBC_01023]